jgi:hypothetical protein
MKLTAEEARKVVYEDHDDFDLVGDSKHIIDHTRWSVIYEAVFFHVPSGEHYKFSWSKGATESQDEQPYEYDDFYESVKVERKIVAIIEWVKKEN